MTVRPRGGVKNMRVVMTRDISRHPVNQMEDKYNMI
jgi:hypothetical protein